MKVHNGSAKDSFFFRKISASYFLFNYLSLNLLSFCPCELVYKGTDLGKELPLLKHKKSYRKLFGLFFNVSAKKKKKMKFMYQLF